MPNLKQKPVFTSLDPVISKSAKSDGSLIAKCLILDHGYRTERFVTLSRPQKDYIESTICIIIQDLCDHLRLLGTIK